MNQSNRPIFALLLFFTIFLSLYTVNIAGWVMHDDEGTDFYEVWQFNEGAVPGEDFIAAQQPLFLYAGSAIVALAGRSVAGLRLLSAVQVVAGALVLFVAVWHIWNARIAILTIGLTLASGQVYELARLFRPDPMMFGWELAGLGLALTAVHTKQRKWWLGAGICYGISILWKPFGIIPVLGLVFYYAVRFWQERNGWQQVFVDGLTFAIPFVLVVVGFSAVFYTNTGFYYLEPFQQHQQLGQENSIWQQIAKTLGMVLFFLVINPIWILIVPLSWMNKAKGWLKSPVMRLPALQLLSISIFLFVTRPVFPRYLIYLTPIMAIFLAVQLDLAFEQIVKERPSFDRAVPATIIVILAFALLTSQPGIINLLTRRESDSQALADLVVQQTAPDSIVLADYATINFLADRQSIYEASIIAGGKVRGGVITGKLLIERIEEDDIRMVLVHVEGGEPPPHQLSELIDADLFQAYLDEHFTFLTTFDRAGQQIEIYQR